MLRVNKDIYLSTLTCHANLLSFSPVRIIEEEKNTPSNTPMMSVLPTTTGAILATLHGTAPPLKYLLDDLYLTLFSKHYSEVPILVRSTIIGCLPEI